MLLCTVLLGGVLAGGVGMVLPASGKVPPMVGAWSLDDPPPLSVEALGDGPLPARELVALAGAASVEQVSDVRPLVGDPLLPVEVEGHSPLLPAGLGALIAQSLGVASLDEAVTMALDDALLAIRDPAGELPPGRAPSLRARVASGLVDELARRSPALVAGDATGPRERVLVAGRGRDAAWHLPEALAEAAEGQTYGAWLDLLQAELVARGQPVSRLDLDLPAGPVDVRALLVQTPAGVDPLAELGRLQAVHLLTRVGLLELVFAGHGRRVVDAVADADRFDAYRLGPLQAGDECQELTILRQRRGSVAVRYGICLGPGDPLVALSCSAAVGTLAGPQHGSATVAWFLESGHWPAFQRVEPTAFRLFPALQQRMLAAAGPEELGPAVAATVQQARAQVTTNPHVTGLARLGPDLWRLRVGGSGEPDVLVAGPGLMALPAQTDLRIGLATTAWRVVRAPAHPAGRPDLAEVIDLCPGVADCSAALADLARQVGGGSPAAAIAALSTSTEQPLVVQLDGRTVRLAAAPDHSNPWVRLAVLRGPAESTAEHHLRARRLASALSTRRVQGLHFAEPTRRL